MVAQQNGGYCHGVAGNSKLLAATSVQSREAAMAVFQQCFPARDWRLRATDAAIRGLVHSLGEQSWVSRSDKPLSKYKNKFASHTGGRLPPGIFAKYNGRVIDKDNAPYCDALKRAVDSVVAMHPILDPTMTRLTTHVQLADYNHEERLGRHADGGCRQRFSFAVASGGDDSAWLKFFLLEHRLDEAIELAELLALAEN